MEGKREMVFFNTRKYWGDLKAKLKKEGSKLSEKIGQSFYIDNNVTLGKIFKAKEIVD